LNSFSGVEKGLTLEIERQRRVLSSGGEVRQQTMLYDERKVEVRPMRSKEESHDYRYFPDPDLPPLVVAPEWVAEIRSELPERPRCRKHRFEEEYELPAYDAGVLTADRATADYYEAVVPHAPDPKTASNWVMGSVLRAVKEEELEITDFPVAPEEVGELLRLVDEGTISRNTGKEVFRRMLDSGRGAREIVESEGLAQVKDEGRLAGWVDDVLAENPDEVERYRDGEERLVGFFMGQVMQKSRGKAEPARVQELLRRKLS
ncbi:MAG: Asp-tRNA(Asn)/Glu-tRNA(Gln) amidotransferase GatCAB subunit B, partial [Longimicrobiales bacterium]